jgi:hypothetical protein
MLEGKKTYLVAIAAVLIAVSAAIQQYTNAQVVEYQYIIEALIALALCFLRKGIKKTGA